MYTCTARTEAAAPLPMTWSHGNSPHSVGQQWFEMMFAAHVCRKAVWNCIDYHQVVSSRFCISMAKTVQFWKTAAMSHAHAMCNIACALICNGIELQSMYWQQPCKSYSTQCTHTVRTRMLVEHLLQACSARTSKNITLDNMMNVCLASRAQQQRICIDAQCHVVQHNTCSYYMYKVCTISREVKCLTGGVTWYCSKH